MRLGNNFFHRFRYRFFSTLLVGLLCSSTNLVPNLALAQAAGGNNSDPSDEEIEQYARGGTEINVKNANIEAIVKIFSKKTRRNYILDEKVKGKVSIYLPAKVSSRESIGILEAVLKLKGFTSVPIGPNLWKIVPRAQAKQTTIPTRSADLSEQPTSAVVTRLIRLKYVNAEDMQKLLGQLVSSDGLLNAYSGTNSLIVIDSEDNIKRLNEIVGVLDVPSVDSDVTIIPIEHAEAADIADKINEILGNEGGSHSSAANSALDRIRARLDSTRFSSRNTGGSAAAKRAASSARAKAGNQVVQASGQPAKIIADDRTNSLIVIASDDETARIRALVAKLDSEYDVGGLGFYVYRCQHASAEELADVLSALSDGGGSSNRSSGTGGSTELFNSASSRRNQQTSETRVRLGSQSRTPGQSRSGSSRNSTPTTANFGEDLSITADPATNSLIIYGSKSDYNKVKELLKDLDVKRRQVLVEAMLLEVGIDENRSLSAEFTGSTGGADGAAIVRNDLGNMATLFSDPTGLQDFSIAAASAGSITLPNDITIPSQSVLVRAAQGNTNANVLSAPTILTADNEEAEIVVGQNVPFVASSSTDSTNLNNTFNQIDRQDVGITLRLTPQISSRDFVTLRLFTEVSNVIDATLASDLGPTTTIRTSETTVIAKDGQMIVTGGLISDSVSNSESGIPFLKDIPLLGAAFRAMSDARRRTNLLIFITPHIIKDQFDARTSTLERRDRLEDVIDSNHVNPHRHEILRSRALDDVSEAVFDDSARPGTVLPPRKLSSLHDTISGSAKPNDVSSSSSTENTAVPEESLAGEGSVDDSTAADDSVADDTSTKAPVLKFRASPAAPSAAVLEQSSEPSVRAKLGSSTPGKIEPVAELPISTPRILVLEGINLPQPISKSNLPFSSESESLVSVVLPANSHPGAKAFFKEGQRYSYRSADTEYTFELIATYSSPADAQAEFPILSSKPYVLSPYEVMNLGLGPWTKAVS